MFKRTRSRNVSRVARPRASVRPDLQRRAGTADCAICASGLLPIISDARIGPLSQAPKEDIAMKPRNIQSHSRSVFRESPRRPMPHLCRTESLHVGDAGRLGLRWWSGVAALAGLSQPEAVWRR